MREWLCYLKEKRTAMALYFVTVLLILGVGALCHVEGLSKLLYGVLLSFAVWGAAGIAGGLRFIRKDRELKAVLKHLEQSEELLLATAPEEAGGLQERDYLALLQELYAQNIRQRNFWKEQTEEQKEYYLMWSHQVKTPISALKLLLKEQGEPGRESFLMQEELFRIEQYAEMALHFQKLESISSDLVLQEYDLDALLRQEVKKYSVLFINRNLSLELVETHMRIVTDEKWFCFCIGQLLSNSIKYTKQGKISIYLERGCLTLADTGIGIREEDLPRIFEKGFTGYNGRLDKQATGIGLYLAKRVLDGLGIEIKAESREGEGTKMKLCGLNGVKFLWEEKSLS